MNPHTFIAAIFEAHEQYTLEFFQNPHVRFDEGEQRERRKPPVALDSTVSQFPSTRFEEELPIVHVDFPLHHAIADWSDSVGRL
jgi:hypothetical protein